MPREIQKLRRLARKWGGDLVGVTQKEWGALKEERLTDRTHPFHEAPFSSRDLGVHWPSRRVIYCGEVEWTEVVHEMGHVFATNANPDDADELEFFGWEYTVVKFIGASVDEWVKHNKDYGIHENEHREFGDIPPKARGKLLQDLVQRGKDAGIIDAKGRPQSVLRKLDLGNLQVELRLRSQMFQSQAKKARETPPLNGNAYEKMCEQAGFSEGYNQAVDDVMRMLYSMTVFPVSTSK
jgi:hypothetical protein